MIFRLALSFYYCRQLVLISLLGFVRREPLQCCERTTKDKFYQYCHVRELNPNKFPGVTLRELVNVEDIFEITSWCIRSS